MLRKKTTNQEHLSSSLNKVELISKTGTNTDFQFVSHQHLNFEIQILLERGY